MSGNDRRDGFADEFGEVESVLGDLREHPETLEAPPADLWDRIAAEVADDDADQVTADVAAGEVAEPTAGGDVVPISHARRNRLFAIVGAAAAAVVLVVAGIVVFSGGDDDEPVVAEAELTYDAQNFDPLGADAASEAELLELSDGSFEIRLVGADLPLPLEGQEDLELWLLNDPAAPTDLVSLGLVDPDDPGVYIVPAGYDPSTFFVVDISVEPRDGDHTHSGRSILRGPLHSV